MRNLAIILLTCGIALAITADPSGYQVVRSKPSGDLILEVWLHKAHENSYSVLPLDYDWLTVTNKNCVVELPKDEYLCFAQMFDSASNAVPLQRNFADLGKHFFDLTYPSAEQPWSSVIKDVLRMKPAHATGPSLGLGQQTMADFVRAEQEVGERRSFNNLEDVFAMKKPGLYRVRLQFQVYARIYKGGQSFAYKLERFEPVEFTVTKE